MDKPLIKAVLIFAFLLSLGFVFVGAVGALRQPSYASLELPKEKPVPPPPLNVVPVTDFSDPVKAAKQIEQMNLVVTGYAAAVKAYESNVSAYNNDVVARTTAWKAKNGDPSAKLTAYEKVVKDTLGGLLLTPLLAALIVYSGIQVSGDVAMTRIAALRNEAAAAQHADVRPVAPARVRAP